MTTKMNLSEVFEGEESGLRKTFDAAIEHEVTLREKWDRYVVGTIEDLNFNSKPSADWWLAQFDAMLAEDIEKLPTIAPYRKLEPCTYCGRKYQFECSCGDVLDAYYEKIKVILEARRLAIKK